MVQECLWPLLREWPRPAPGTLTARKDSHSERSSGVRAILPMRMSCGGAGGRARRAAERGRGRERGARETRRPDDSARESRPRNAEGLSRSVPCSILTPLTPTPTPTALASLQHILRNRDTSPISLSSSASASQRFIQGVPRRAVSVAFGRSFDGDRGVGGDS